METIKKIIPAQAADVIDIRKPLGLIYVLHAGRFIGVDNSNGYAWTEEFVTPRKRRRW